MKPKIHEDTNKRELHIELIEGAKSKGTLKQYSPINMDQPTFSFKGFNKIMQLNSRLQKLNCDKNSAIAPATEINLNGGDHQQEKEVDMTNSNGPTTEDNVNCTITRAYSLQIIHDQIISDVQGPSAMNSAVEGALSNKDKECSNDEDEIETTSDIIDEDEEEKEEEIGPDDYERVVVRIRNVRTNPTPTYECVRPDEVSKKEILDNNDTLQTNYVSQPQSCSQANGQNIPSQNEETKVSTGKDTITEEILVPNSGKVSDENLSDHLEPTLQEPKSPEIQVTPQVMLSTPPLQPPTLHAWDSMPQFCIFCPASFKDNNAFETHIVKCNSILTQLADFKKRKCLVCQRRIQHFNVTGLLRHSISCIIIDREQRLRREQENSSYVKKEPSDRNKIETAKGETESTNSNSPRRRLRSTSISKNDNDEQESLAGQHSKQQVQTLVAHLEKEKYPTSSGYRQLAEETGLSHFQVKRWFARQRYLISSTETKSDKCDDDETKRVSPTRAKKRKRGGGKHSHFQTKTLKEYFEINMYPSVSETATLAQKTKLTPTQLKHWFCNARRRVSSAEREQARKALASLAIKAEPVSEYSDSEEEETSNEEENAGDGKPSEPKSKYLKISEMSNQLLKVLEKEYQANPRPKLTEVIFLSQKTGLQSSSIIDWFTRRRKRNDNEVEVVDGDEQKNVAAEKCNGSKHEDEDRDTVGSLKMRSSRQKLLALKKFSGPQIRDVLNDHKTSMTQILLLYCDAESETRQTLEEECVNLALALEHNNPFTAIQIAHFVNWEEDFVTGMYPEKDGQQWINLVETFRVKLLQVWSRVLVYSCFVGISLENGALEIYQLTMPRNEKVSVGWVLPDLFQQVRNTSGGNLAAFDTEESDSDDESLFRLL